VANVCITQCTPHQTARQHASNRDKPSSQRAHGYRDCVTNACMNWPLHSPPQTGGGSQSKRANDRLCQMTGVSEQLDAARMATVRRGKRPHRASRSRPTRTRSPHRTGGGSRETDRVIGSRCHKAKGGTTACRQAAHSEGQGTRRGRDGCCAAWRAFVTLNSTEPGPGTHGTV
jgi:hypothetical protein